MAKLTQDRNKTTIQGVFCDTRFFAVNQKTIIISAINISLSVTAFLRNVAIVIIIAL